MQRRNNNNKNNKNNKARRRVQPRRVARGKQRARAPPRVARIRRTVPMANISRVPKYWRIRSVTNTSMTVDGSDLLTAVPDNQLGNNNTNVMAIIPANPAYWKGTRMALLAATFQNYRPLKFTIHYVPHTASTQPGSIIGGTLWNQAPATTALQSTLKTSNGGFITQCFAKASKNVKLAGNLPKNLYDMAGDLNSNTNPFYFIAITQGCYDQQGNRVIPGYFYVTYSYVLKNPVGSAYTYEAYNSVALGTVPQAPQHRSLIMATPPGGNENDDIPVGTLIQADNTVTGMLTTVTYKIEGNQVVLNPLAIVWAFTCTAVNGREVDPEPLVTEIDIQYSSTGVGNGNAKNFNPGTLIYQLTNDDKIDVLTSTRLNGQQPATFSYTVPQGITYYTVAPTNAWAQGITAYQLNKNPFFGMITEVNANSQTIIEISGEIDRRAYVINFVNNARSISIRYAYKKRPTMKIIEQPITDFKQLIQMEEDKEEAKKVTELFKKPSEGDQLLLTHAYSSAPFNFNIIRSKPDEIDFNKMKQQPIPEVTFDDLNHRLTYKEKRLLHKQRLEAMQKQPPKIEEDIISDSSDEEKNVYDDLEIPEEEDDYYVPEEEELDQEKLTKQPRSVSQKGRRPGTEPDSRTQKRIHSVKPPDARAELK